MNDTRQYSIKRATVPALILLLGAVGLFVMTYLTIPVAEDNEYGVTGFLRRNGMSSDLNLSGIWNHVVHLMYNCNGRIVDKLAVPILALMPRWMSSVLNAIVYLFIAGGAFKLIALAIGGKWHGKPLHTSMVGFMATYPWLASAFVLLMALFFPWDNAMMLMDYQLNYVWTSCVVVWLVYYFCNPRLICDGPAWLFVVVLILSVGAATLHELIPCVLCCAFLVPALWSGSRKLLVRRVLIIVALFVGFEILTHMPGHMRRVGYTVMEFDWRRLFPTCKGLMPGPAVMPGVVYMLTLAVFALWRIPTLSLRSVWRQLKNWLMPRRNRSALWMLTVVATGGFVASCAVMSMFGGNRIMSFGVVFSFVGGLALLGCWPGGLPRWFATVLKGAIVAIGICAVGVWSFSITIESEINRQFRQLEPHMIAAGRNATIYYDLLRYWWIEVNDVSPMPWRMMTPLDHRIDMTYFNPLADPYNIMIVPSALSEMERDADYDDIVASEDLPEGYQWVDRELGILRYRECYLYTNPDNLNLKIRVLNPMRYRIIDGALNFDATYADGVARRTYFGIRPFTTPRTKRMAYWLEPAIDSEQIANSAIITAADLLVRGPFCIVTEVGSYGHLDYFPNEPLYHTKEGKK